MKRTNKILTVLLVLALILTPVLRPEFSVQAEEGDLSVQEEIPVEGEVPEAEEPEVQELETEVSEAEEDSETETPEAEDPEGEFIPDEEGEITPEEEATPEAENSAPETPEEEESQEEMTSEEETPDPETPGEEESPEEETLEETEDIVTPEETPEGVHFAFEEMIEADLEALPLSVLLGYLRDEDENAFTLPEGADTLWIRILDGNGNVVYNENYGAESNAVLNLRQYFVTPGYTLELTAGTGEREQPGNTVYQVEMGSEGYPADPTSMLPLKKVEALFIGNKLDTIVKWGYIFENIYDRETGGKLEVPADAVVMLKGYEGEFTQITAEDEADLTYYDANMELEMELIIGSGDQWNTNNTRIDLLVKMVGPPTPSYRLYQDTDAGRIGTEPYLRKIRYYEYWFDSTDEQVKVDNPIFIVEGLQEGETYYVGLDISTDDMNPYWDIEIYDMTEALANNDLSARVDITSQIMNQPMENSGAGYPCTYESEKQKTFLVIYRNKNTGEIDDVLGVRYLFDGITEYTVYGQMFNENGDPVGDPMFIVDSDGRIQPHVVFGVPESEWDMEYTFKLDIQYVGRKRPIGVIKGYYWDWNKAYAALEAGGDLMPQITGDGYKDDYKRYGEDGEGVLLSVLFANHMVCSFDVKVRISTNPVFNAMLYDSQGQEVVEPFTIEGQNSVNRVLLKPGFSTTEPYFLRLTLGEEFDSGLVWRIAAGAYDNYLDGELMTYPDIMPQLLGNDESVLGYEGVYGGEGLDFTLFFRDNTLHQINVTVEEIYPELELHGVNQEGRELTSYVVDEWYQGNASDTQYRYNYRTVFVYDEDADLSRLTLDYDIYPEGAQLTANGVVVDSNTPIDFSQGPVHLAVTFGGGVRTNYTVSVVKRSLEPQLFVYPSDTPVTDPETGVVPEEDYVREVFLDENNEYKHDILIANLGETPIENLKVELVGLEGEGSMNCTLDDYWNMDGGTLPPFTEPVDESGKFNLPNIVKLTLIPSGDGGPISEMLTISADGIEPIKIRLIGVAQDPRITTGEDLPVGVKYVPYSTIIDTNCQYDWIQTTFTVSELPSGLEWREKTGEIYGIPQEPGEYWITVTANFTVRFGSNYQFLPSTVDLYLKIEDNTDENVFTATDSGYALEQAVGIETSPHHYVLTELGDELFVSEGELFELIDVWLNGQKLVRVAEYGAESGSSRITVWKQTLENKADKSGGKNTLAAEFREDGNEDNPLHRTAQNFYVKMEGSQPTPPGPTEPGPKPTEPEAQPTTAPPVPTQGPPTPTVGPLPTTPVDPTDFPQPTTPAGPTDSPWPTTPAGPTDSPWPTTPAGPTDSPQPTTPAVPTATPRPTATAAPTSVPQPTATAAPTNAPLPTATAAPTNVPRPTATQAPDLTDAPKPSEVPNPSRKPEPTKQPNPTRVPQASGTPGPTEEPGDEPQPSGGPVLSGTPGPTENPGASDTPVPAVSGTPLPTATPVEVNYVSLAASLTDGDGNPLVTRNLEMHSDPVKSTTDVNGLAGFGRVEYGTHTVYLIDENGNLGPSTTFTLEPGDDFSMEAGKVTGKRGSAMTISLTFVDGKLILNGVQEGIKSKPAPQTGDESMPGVWLLLMAISVFAGMIILRKDEK